MTRLLNSLVVLSLGLPGAISVIASADAGDHAPLPTRMLHAVVADAVRDPRSGNAWQRALVRASLSRPAAASTTAPESIHRQHPRILQVSSLPIPTPSLKPQEIRLVASVPQEESPATALPATVLAFIPQPTPKPAHTLLAVEARAALLTGLRPLRLPVAGTYAGRYGEPTETGERRRGMVLSASPGAEVVSPLDAEVMFAGPFLEYGDVVILHHGKGYHTLLAGLSRIDCHPGQKVLEGEILGAMGNAASQLYLELRERQQPIDPTPWLRGA